MGNAKHYSREREGARVHWLTRCTLRRYRGGVSGSTHPGSADSDVDLAMRIASRELGAQRARLYLFGSRARGQAARASDIDIAIVPDAPLLPGTLARIRDALEESTIPFEVEVVDLSCVDEPFRRRVLAEAIAWNG